MQREPVRIIVEGWRDTPPHSFTIVNGFQMLELLKNPGVALFHVDKPFTFNPTYHKKVEPLFSSEQSARLRNVAAPDAGMRGDATYRIVTQYQFSKSTSRRTAVFVNAEWGKVQDQRLREAGIDPGKVAAQVDPEIIVVTPSRWSKWGLVRTGFRPESIAIVPHGVDPEIFKPADPAWRQELRRRAEWQDAFVFLNNSLMGEAKGLDILVKAFSAVSSRFPQARLVLKGRDDIVWSRKLLSDLVYKSLPPAKAEAVFSKIHYTGHTTSCEAIAQMYQAADAYVAPYRAEGFCLPVLEAAASGLPVLCTKGGATDDFTDPGFALAIESKVVPFRLNNEKLACLEPDLDHLISVMCHVIENPSFADQARQRGPLLAHGRFSWAHAVEQLLRVLA
jgi:glycosyltransferase involved in cell wall biosynthesis